MEPNILTLIADNPSLFDAVKKLVLEHVTDDSDIVPTNLTNEQLGQLTRARIDGARKVEAAFTKIASFKTYEGTKQPPNPAR